MPWHVSTAVTFIIYIMHFHSNGKLLISGEYLVMQGALALAVPVKFGQALSVKKSNASYLHWETYVQDKLWFSARFNHDFSFEKASDEQTAAFLSKLLKTAQRLNPQFLSEIRNWF